MGAFLSSAEVPQEQTIYEFTVKDNTGKDLDLGIYKGKVLLVVNVASKYFEILAFPCNQFLHQEPGSSEHAKEFACTRYQAEYPIFQKVRVNGSNTAPVYKFLKYHGSGFMGSRIKWNFTKFLVNKEGKVIARYGPTTTPFSIEKDIKKALGI